MSKLADLAVFRPYDQAQCPEDEPAKGVVLGGTAGIVIHEGGYVRIYFTSGTVELHGPLATAMRAGFKAAGIEVEELC